VLCPDPVLEVPGLILDIDRLRMQSSLMVKHATLSRPCARFGASRAVNYAMIVCAASKGTQKVTGESTTVNEKEAKVRALLEVRFHGYSSLYFPK